MKISFRTRYLVFIALLHLVITGLAYWVLKEHKLFFLLAEVLILVSVYVAVRIYRQFEGPAQFISAGIEAIKDKDFTIKFVQTGNREVDQLIDVYNLMIDQLRQERTRQMEGQFFLEKLVEASPIAILIFDLDGRIASVN
jgi:nitrogen fixation/metabolism regulation signal transduction histidine kinase